MSDLLTVKAVSCIVSETFSVRTKFLFNESFLQNGSPISAILFVKTLLPYLIENDINTNSDTKLRKLIIFTARKEIIYV